MSELLNQIAAQLGAHVRQATEDSVAQYRTAIKQAIALLQAALGEAPIITPPPSATPTANKLTPVTVVPKPSQMQISNDKPSSKRVPMTVAERKARRAEYNRRYRAKLNAKDRVTFADPWNCLMCRNAGELCAMHEKLTADGTNPPKYVASRL